MSKLIQTLTEIDRRYSELDAMLADPANSTDPTKLQEIGRERAELQVVVDAFSEYRGTQSALEETELMAREEDVELAEMVDDEIKSLRTRRDELLNQIKALLAPRDPNDQKNVIVE